MPRDQNLMTKYGVTTYDETRYPVRPGTNYIGEVPGYVYDPWKNKYIPNPKTQEQFLIDQGAIDKPQEPPKPPSIGQQVMPVMAGAGAGALMTEVGKGIYKGIVGKTATELAEEALAQKALNELGTNAATQGTTQLATQGATQGATQLATQGAAELGTQGVVQGGNVAAQGSGLLSSGGTTAGTTAAGEGVGSMAMKAIPYVGAAVGAYGIYDIANRWGKNRKRDTKNVGMTTASGAASGAAIGNAFGGYGAAIGAVVGGLFGFASSMIRSGKHKDQQQRDAMRSALEQLGISESAQNGKDSWVTLADGSKFSIGKEDNHPVLGDKKIYNVNVSHPLAGQAIGWLNPLTHILSAGNTKMASDATGMLTNAVLSNAKNIDDVRNNILPLYQKLGLTPEEAAVGIRQLVSEGKMTEAEAAAFQVGINTLYDNKPTANTVVDPNQNLGGLLGVANKDTNFDKKKYEEEIAARNRVLAEEKAKRDAEKAKAQGNIPTGGSFNQMRGLL